MKRQQKVKPVLIPPYAIDKVVEENPKVVEEKSEVVEENPKVVEEKPEVVEENPKVVEEKPEVVEENPKVVEEKPEVAKEEVVEMTCLTFDDFIKTEYDEYWQTLKDKKIYDDIDKALPNLKYIHSAIKRPSDPNVYHFGRNCNVCGILINKNNITTDFYCIASHYCCKDCLKSYALMKLKQGRKVQEVNYYDMTINCICNNINNYKCRTFKISDVMTQEEYEKEMGPLEKISLKDIKLINCSLPNCGGKLTDNKCQTCHIEYCNMCGDLAHPKKECNKEVLENRINVVKMGGQDVGMCGNCNMTIFRASGCDSMFCWNCSTYINWQTGEVNAKYDLNLTGKNYYEIYRDQLKTKKANNIRRYDG